MSTDTKIEITDATVLAKMEKGEELTPQEQEFVKGNPDLQRSSEPAKKEEEENLEDIKIKKEPEAGADTPKKSEEEKKPESSAGDPKKETPEERRRLIEAELEKPEAQQDLTNFSDNEIGLYVEMKKQRRKNQKLEEENEVLRIERITKKLKEDLPKKEEAKTDEEDVLKLLQGRDDDDIPTVGELKKIIAGLKAKPVEKKEEARPVPIRTPDQVKLESLEADSRFKAKGITDFHEVTEWAEAVLKDDDDAREILIDTAKAGGNTAEKTYFLIKGSKHWPEIKKRIETERARVKPPAKEPAKENVDRGRRLEENDGKIKTTGPGSGSSTEVGEYTNEEIAAMTIDDIKKLPKETRKQILRKFGSEPNHNK